MNTLAPELHLIILKQAATLPRSSFAPCLVLASTCQWLYNVYRENLTALVQAHLSHHAPSPRGLMLLQIASILPSPRALFGIRKGSPWSVRVLEETKTSLQQILNEGGAARSTLPDASLKTLVRTLTMFRAARIALHRHCLVYEWAELYEDDEEEEFAQDSTNKMAQLSAEIWDSKIDPNSQNTLTEQLLELIFFHNAVRNTGLDLSEVEGRLSGYFRCKDELSGLLSAFCGVIGDRHEEFWSEFDGSTPGREEPMAMWIRATTDVETMWWLVCAKDPKGKAEAAKKLFPRKGNDYSREVAEGEEKARVPFKSAYPELDGLSLEDAPSIVYVPGASKTKKTQK